MLSHRCALHFPSNNVGSKLRSSSSTINRQLTSLSTRQQHSTTSKHSFASTATATATPSPSLFSTHVSLDSFPFGTTETSNTSNTSNNTSRTSQTSHNINLSQWAPEIPGDTDVHDVESVFAAGMRQHHICNTAFPIAHVETIKPYRVPRHRDQKAIRDTLLTAYGDLDELMLYAHVPFCHTRCDFCEYTVVNPKIGRQDSVQDLYFDSLLKEIDLYKDLLQLQNKKLVGFDIGGGTPSMASEENIARLVEKVINSFGSFGPSKKYEMAGVAGQNGMEISIETTPRIAAEDPNKMKLYKRLGIDRVSFGLQTTDFALAKKLGRLDANNDNYVDRAVENIRNAGFKSFNIDLMYGFPIRKGTKDKWEQTLLDTIALNPDHITLYRMRYKGTKMAHVADRVELEQVNRQEQMARRLLMESGYVGWVGKNTYSRVDDGRNGCSDYLNHRVMNGIPYIGTGLGAQSYSHCSLAYNLGAVTKKLSQYIKSNQLDRIPTQDLYHLSRRASAAKFISVSFYFGGIDIDSFDSIFGEKSFESMYEEEIKFLVERKLMQFETLENKYRRLQMTVEGKKHFAGVVSLFYTPRIQKYLLGLGHKAAV